MNNRVNDSHLVSFGNYYINLRQKKECQNFKTPKEKMSLHFKMSIDKDNHTPHLSGDPQSNKDSYYVSIN